MHENLHYPKWTDLSKEDQEFLKEHYPEIAMDLIFGLPVKLPDADNKRISLR